MGLDMYIEREVWPSFYEHGKKSLKIESPDFTIDPGQVLYIVERVCYWRKANAIHKWFVDNVQHGVDDCGRYLLKLSDIKRLLSVVERAILSETPWEVLPTTEGFFFGDVDYRDWYYRMLHETVVQLTRLIDTWDDNSYYYYTSSW